MNAMTSFEGDGDRVVAGLLYLLVACASREPCLGRMAAVAQHFELLADCADAAPALRRLADQLHAAWLEHCRAARDAALVGVQASLH